jgi:hypothetical protein
MADEATKVLLMDNDFFVLKVNGLCLRPQKIPVIRFLSAEKNKSPALKVEIGLVGGVPAEANGNFALITTPEGVLPIISEIWSVPEYHHRGARFIPFRPDMKLSLNFNFKSPPRYEILAKLILKPWGNVNCISQLELICNMKKPLVDRFKQNILQGPSVSELAATLKEQRSMVKEKIPAK